MLIVSLFVLLIAIALPSVHVSTPVLLRTTSITLVLAAALVSNAVNSLAMGSGVNAYSGLLHVTSTGLSIDLLLLVAGAVAITPWAPMVLRTVITPVTAHPTVANYTLFVLFTTIGGMTLVSSADIVTVYLAIELQSFALYVMASVLYRDSETATHAGLLYFMLGGLSSSIILFGSALLYQYTGHTGLEAIFATLAVNLDDSTAYELAPAALGITMMAVGFLFKITAAPFHNWGPDVYDGVPTVAATWLAVLPKVSILGFLLELQVSQVTVMVNGQPYNAWVSLMLITALLSLIVGTVVGLAQTRIKRLLAYSTVSHVGFMLLALGVRSEEAVEAFLFYLAQYTLTGLNLFLIVLAVGYALRATPGSSHRSYDLGLISELTGVFRGYPALGVSMAVCLFSMAGIPPLAGFYGKQGVLYAALHADYTFLAVVAIVVSVISASYYLRVIRIVHFDAQDTSVLTVSAPSITMTHSYAIAVITASIVGFMATPDLILDSLRLLALTTYHA